MASRLRRELRVHRAISGISLLGMVFVAAAAFQQPARGNLGEITVERINVVDRNGQPKIVISNSERQTPGAMNGKPFPPRRREAGLIFFNEEGDEAGGLVYTGQNGRASSQLSFDQYKQDQTVRIGYDGVNGTHTGGLKVEDKSDVPLDEWITKMGDARRLPDGPAKSAALDALNPHPRIFVGKDETKAAVVSLSDGRGRIRLLMKVEADGAASLEMLDENGKIVSRMPAQ